MRGVARPVDLEHLPGLEMHRVLSSPTALRIATRIAPYSQHRMHDEMHGRCSAG
jgi:hypothetical protein